MNRVGRFSEKSVDFHLNLLTSFVLGGVLINARQGGFFKFENF